MESGFDTTLNARQKTIESGVFNYGTGPVGINTTTGTIRYRLQINTGGTVSVYQSLDGGITWPNEQQIAAWNNK